MMMDRWRTRILAVYFWLIICFLYGPIFIMAVLSLQGPNGGMTLPMYGVSLHWWQRLFTVRLTELRGPLFRSLAVAVETGIIVAVLGFLAGLAVRRQVKGSSLLTWGIFLALMTPGILLGLGMSLWWRFLRLEPGHLPLLGVHVIWALPFAYLILVAVLSRIDPRLEESARDLGASGFATFTEVLLPLVWPGILSAALFGFTLSLNEFERSILVTSENTLPLQLWSIVTVRVLDPDVYALGTLTVLITLAIVFVLLVPSIVAQVRRFRRD
uniref:ABC transporter permease n=1 Tax=Thermorudis peleae TaxID=1382356 RepID=A0A831WXN8_9BACT